MTIWFHQPQRVVRAYGRSRAAARRYARLTGMGYRTVRWPPGAATMWQNRRRGEVSFAVELSAGPAHDSAAAARHARAILRIARSR